MSSWPPHGCWWCWFCCACTSRLRSSVCCAMTSARFGGGGGGYWEPLAWSVLNPSGVPRVAPTIWKIWKVSITTGYACFHYQRYDVWYNTAEQHKNDDKHTQWGWEMYAIRVHLSKTTQQPCWKEEILDKDDDYNGQLVVMIYYITVVVCKIHEKLRV
jgi:hypothetical protein